MSRGQQKRIRSKIRSQFNTTNVELWPIPPTVRQDVSIALTATGLECLWAKDDQQGWSACADGSIEDLRSTLMRHQLELDWPELLVGGNEEEYHELGRWFLQKAGEIAQGASHE